MAEANAAVRAQTEWNAERLRAAESFWVAKERLYREVWRLGLGRAVFRLDIEAPDWQADYLKALGVRQEEAGGRVHSEA